MSVDHYDVPELYEPEVSSAISRFVKPGDLCIDAGASVGYHTCILSRLAGVTGLVLAFEPNQESFDHLERNIEKRKLPNVKRWRVALWSEDIKELTLYSTKEIGYTSICHYHTAVYSEVVAGWKLDTVLPKGLPQPSAIKIDCEMSEFHVLRGAEKTLRAGVDCVIMEMNYSLLFQNGFSDKEIRQYMRDLGYEMFLINIQDEEKTGFHDPILVEPHVEVKMGGNSFHMNVLFSTEEKVKARWKTCAHLSAPTVTIAGEWQQGS